MNPSKEETKKNRKIKTPKSGFTTNNTLLSFYLLEATTAIPPPEICRSLLVRLSRPPKALEYCIGPAFKGIPSCCLGLLFERKIHQVGFHQDPTFISRPSDRFAVWKTTLHCNTLLGYRNIPFYRSQPFSHSHTLSYCSSSITCFVLFAQSHMLMPWIFTFNSTQNVMSLAGSQAEVSRRLMSPDSTPPKAPLPTT